MVVWEAVDSSIAYVIRHRKVGEEEWTEVVDTMNSFELTEMENCEVYEVQVQTVCARDTSGYVESLLIPAVCNTAVEDLVLHLNVQVFPNPFDKQLSLEITSEEYQDLIIEVLQLDGKSIRRQTTNMLPGKQHILIDNLENLASGMYLISLKNQNGILMKKVLHE